MKGKEKRSAQPLAEQVADTMFALSTPTRVQILICLLNGPHAVVDLMEVLGLEQSAVSHQLRVLRDHALVKVEKTGRLRVYALQDDHVRALLDETLDHVQRRIDQESSKIKGNKRLA